MGRSKRRGGAGEGEEQMVDEGQGVENRSAHNEPWGCTCRAQRGVTIAYALHVMACSVRILSIVKRSGSSLLLGI